MMIAAHRTSILAILDVIGDKARLRQAIQKAAGDCLVILYEQNPNDRTSVSGAVACDH